MGLDCSHNAWHGAYSAFMRWRMKLAEVAGLPPLELMDGFYDPSEYGTLYLGQRLDDETYRHKRERLSESLPIKWECLQPSPLHELLYHSDCDGEIPWRRCGPIADAIEKLLPLLPNSEAAGHIGNWKDKTAQFIAGLRAAAKAKEPLTFG